MRRSAWIAVLAGGGYALLSVLTTVGWVPLLELDDAVARWADRTASRHPAWVRAMELWTHAFSPAVVRLLVMGVALGLALRGRRQAAGFAVLAVVGGALVSTGMKFGVDRDRPVVDAPFTTAVGQSFPSGHASSAVLACGVLLLVFDWGRWRPVAVVAAVLVPLATAYTRVGLVVHWTSDVVGGLLLGVAVLAAAYAVTIGAGGRTAAPAP